MNAPPALHDDARALLRSLSGPHGIRASTSSSANYGAVFARDAVMAGIAGLLADDSTISAGLTRTLEQLRDLQGEQGQIPSNYQVRGAEAPRVSFGSLVPRLDAPLWYLIGVAAAARAGALDPAPFRRSVVAVIGLLDALEYNGRHLLYVPVGGDWADEYVYEGYVLHDQVLRAWALRLVADVFQEQSWGAKADRIEQAIDDCYWTHEAIDRGYPLAAFTPTRTFDMFDLATCSLLALSGVAPAVGASALHWIVERYVSQGALPPAFAPVIDEGHPDWPALSRYHLHGFRNRPHEYHNGGIWPIWLGWLSLALARHGRIADVVRLDDALRRRLNADYRFEEYLHGVTGAPGGVTGMAYSATGLLFTAEARAPRRLGLILP
ncbi:MAG TPA: glycoside hydrolase 100 family protein [Gemmatimonadaceae bacterium]|nr:glycoside hydrolase 100 family protein [Gemmatimonadaceae bacterium]